MDSGFYAACTGLMSRMDALDTIANNLANSTTAGFQASQNVFSEVLASTDNTELSVINQDVNDYGVLSGTRLDTSQGSLQKTGNELDLAIEGPGYFAVKTQGGEMYTRSGQFRVSASGLLVTAGGDPVLGPKGPIQILGEPLSISSDGTISVSGAVAGQLKLVTFPPSTPLQSVGSGYLSAPPKSAVPAPGATVQQGMLESSNVNPVTNTVAMITAQREVETMRHVLTMFDTDMNKIAVQDIPHVS
ncbi:flagellar basal-body rod protein FlgF [Granulicella sp. 5B5]|uniref:flagellar basal-body rod protein FlgF n=1 Tax=Granulicella sp. 5B5 TaxID=1617967 RepID=UPI0015F5BDB3|nr:flagellar basal-body rod protein FlgF [Granulicella sp. 5B5]QMV17511.1 flagellar basal-body rod protein FlgF [Granulicella sp. 5B5]